MLREGCQGKAWLSLCSLSPGAPRGVPGEGLSLCSLSPGALRGCQGKACLSLCSLSPGAPRGVPGEGLSACRHPYNVMPSFTL